MNKNYIKQAIWGCFKTSLHIAKKADKLYVFMDVLGRKGKINLPCSWNNIITELLNQGRKFMQLCKGLLNTKQYF